jgi:TrmH family RNA methyltransferase
MAKAATITSAANPLLKEVRRAIVRGGLTSRGYAVAESSHLLEEARRSGCEVAAVLTAASRPVLDRSGGPSYQIPDALFERLSGVENSQGVIALVKPPVWTMEQLFEGQPLVVVLDGLQDPGNAGTIVRAAEAFGATGVLFVRGSVSPYNPKTLRASAGSLFRVPCVYGVDAASARDAVHARGVDLYAAVPARLGARALADVDLTRPCCLIIGSEAHGVGTELRTTAREISIPTAGVESLNAGVAAGVLLYEARRQRTTRQ